MKRRDPRLITALALIASAALLGLLAIAGPSRPFDPTPRPLSPLRVQVLVPPSVAKAGAAPRGGSIGPDGLLTILSAPGTAGRALPWSSPPSQWGVQPQRFDPLPETMLGGIRALFVTLPIPVEEQDRMMVTTLERRVGSGRLVLVRGCFRLDGPRGPIAVFPTGTRLALRDGYLIAGPPGWPPALSARVGEHVFWEGDTYRRFADPARRRVEGLCGPGPIQTVSPASATVQQATNDGFAASNFADRYGVPWDKALREVRRCRERLEKSLGEQGNRAPMVDNVCGSTPPSPIADPVDCPPGTTLVASICRTPEGHVRPIPEI